MLSGNEISRNNLVVWFFKDSQSVKPAWLLMGWQDCLGIGSTPPLHIALSIIPPRISPGKSCFCALTDFHVLSQKHSDSTQDVNSSEYTSLEFLKGLSNNPSSKEPFPNFYNDSTNDKTPLEDYTNEAGHRERLLICPSFL